MTLNKRGIAILQQIIHSGRYLPIHELMKQFNVSRRTIYYEIDRINDWLKSQSIDPIKHERSRGFYIKDFPKDISFMDAIPYEYSADERVRWIALHLLINEDRLILRTFEQYLDVSRNTIINDMNKLRDIVQKYDLKLVFERQRGYVLQGSEVDIRKLRVYCLSFFLNRRINREGFLKEISHLIKVSSINLLPIYEALSVCEKDLQVHYADEDLFSMAIHIYLNIYRMKSGHYIQMDHVEKEVLQSTLEFKVAMKVTETLAREYDVDIPLEEAFFLTTYLLTAKLQYKDRTEIFSTVQVSIKAAISKMVSDFQLYAGVVFQDREQIESNLLTHLEPAFYRSVYGLNIENPLTTTIKERYKEIYILTQKVVHHFENLTRKKLTENEIAFIAIHFGGWLRSEQGKMERKKALIICNSGIGTSEILRKQLEQLFPMVDFPRVLSAREYESKKHWPNVSFAVSTVDVVRKGHPLFVVSPILSEEEKSNLIAQINSQLGFGVQYSKAPSITQLMRIIKSYTTIENEEQLIKELRRYFHEDSLFHKGVRPSLANLLEGNIQIVQRVTDWKAAIYLACQPLLEGKKIKDRYIHAMINVLLERGPYVIVGPGIALPHALPSDGVIDVSMSLLILREPVHFLKEKEHEVYLIFVLAPENQDSHLRAMSELNNLLSDGENVRKLRESESINDVWRQLNVKL